MHHRQDALIYPTQFPAAQTGLTPLKCFWYGALPATEPSAACYPDGQAQALSAAGLSPPVQKCISPPWLLSSLVLSLRRGLCRLREGLGMRIYCLHGLAFTARC